MIISRILGRHNQEWPKDFHCRYFLSICLLKKFIVLWKFNLNRTGCIWITTHWYETYLPYLSRKKNIAFINLFETSFGSDIFVSFTNFECQDIDYSGSHWVENFEIYIVDGLLLTKFQSPSLKIWRGVDDWNTLTKMQFLINSSFRIY